MRKVIPIVLGVLLAACTRSPEGGHGVPANKPAQQKVDPATLPFVGKVWLSADFASPKGTIRIFLPDGTLVMDSCFEPYKLSKWLPRSADDIVWREETAPIEARVQQPGPKDLVLRIKLPREMREDRYIAASVPYECPNAPR
jgi:hypothetical protein